MGQLFRNGGMSSLMTQMASTLFGRPETEDSMMHAFSESEDAMKGIASKFKDPVRLRCSLSVLFFTPFDVHSI